jgi:hypothetical protein
MEYPSKQMGGNYATLNDAVSRHFFPGWIIPFTNKTEIHSLNHVHVALYISYLLDSGASSNKH